MSQDLISTAIAKQQFTLQLSTTSARISVKNSTKLTPKRGCITPNVTHDYAGVNTFTDKIDKTQNV